MESFLFLAGLGYSSVVTTLIALIFNRLWGNPQNPFVKERKRQFFTALFVAYFLDVAITLKLVL